MSRRAVTAESYRLQHEGIARAPSEDPALVAAIAAAGGIEALVLEWSDPDKIAVTVDWTRIGDGADAAQFAAAVRASQRSSHGLTAIGAALLAAAAAFERSPEPAARRVIDISGDGMANFGPPPTQARDLLVGRGITINGLAILSLEPWLAQYYEHNVVGGDARLHPRCRQVFASFADAMLKKLAEEVSRRAALLLLCHAGSRYQGGDGCHTGESRYPRRGWVPACDGTTSQMQ